MLGPPNNKFALLKTAVFVLNFKLCSSLINVPELTALTPALAGLEKLCETGKFTKDCAFKDVDPCSDHDRNLIVGDDQLKIQIFLTVLSTQSYYVTKMFWLKSQFCLCMLAITMLLKIQLLLC